MQHPLKQKCHVRITVMLRMDQQLHNMQQHWSNGCLCTLMYVVEEADNLCMAKGNHQ